MAGIQHKENGNIALWPEFLDSNALATLRVAGGRTIAAYAAAPKQQGATTSPRAFTAYAGTPDDAVHNIEGAPGDDGEQKATTCIVIIRRRQQPSKWSSTLTSTGIKWTASPQSRYIQGILLADGGK